MFETRLAPDYSDLYFGDSGFSDLHKFDIPNSEESEINEEINIRIAGHRDEQNIVNSFLNRRYSWRGYGANHQVPMVENCVTFTASSKNSLIGTLSLTVDSSEGLSCDKTFSDELAELRSFDGAMICELTKFAFDSSRSSLDLLGALFHIIFIYGTYRYDCTDLFIEVNPRHRRFYETMLGFKTVGTPKTNVAVGALSYLMWLKVSDIRGHIDRHADRGRVGTRSLYPYFFSAEEEMGIYARLVGRSLDDLRTAAGNHSLETSAPMPVAEA
jgi:hypothetical protein